MKKVKYVLIFIMIINVSCRRNEINNPIDDWFQDPPVSPITQTIKTVIPVGYAASLAIMHMKGYNVPNVKSGKQKSATLLYVDTSVDYPYKFKNDSYEQMIIAYVQTDENTALVSVFFTDMDIVSGNFKLKNVIAFPVILTEEKITAVYASIDINIDIDPNSDTGLNLSFDDIEENILKLENERTDKYGTDLAIAQNAWIIDIYHQGTYDNLLDDKFNIFGGQQAIAVEDYDTESSVGALQMAMIDVDFSSECLKNPTNGYVFMQDVEIETSTNKNDIVFGHVFYEFHSNCNGDIKVDIATGNFIFAIGKELDLGLN